MIKYQKGFTLIELLIAIAIFGILSTMVTANLRGGSSGRELALQSENVTSLLRDAQVRALAGQPHQGQIPLGGYGIHVMTCSTPPCEVTLYADLDGSFTLDPGEEIQVVTLGTGVVIQALSHNDPFDVVFKPPRPFICFGSDCSGIGQATITMGTVRSGATTDIIIDQVSGRISP
jgi:prepilin-type N-terminal cleavage/methylation domain-containing protein